MYDGHWPTPLLHDFTTNHTSQQIQRFCIGAKALRMLLNIYFRSNATSQYFSFLDFQLHSNLPVHLYEKIDPQPTSNGEKSIYVNEMGQYVNVNIPSDLQKPDNPYNVPDELNPYIIPNVE